MSNLTPAEDALWMAITRELEVNRLKHRTGGGRSAAMWNDGRSEVGTHQSFSQPDGTDVVYWITATHTHAGIRVYTKTFVDSKDEFWKEKITEYADDPQGYLIVNSKMYRIGSPAREGSMRGFGGRMIKFTRLSHPGYEVATRNLWFNGRIPAKFRDQLPDNATFLDGFDGPWRNE
jgi:hypothetical protein